MLRNTQLRAKKNRVNRSKHIANHTTGSKSYTRLMTEMVSCFRVH